ncbi:MAG: hypothetical protein M3081_13805 [Gemmatimonadota bacterium]|nr:hypothetical protein [Gemmatimonadota bacterium]
MRKALPLAVRATAAVVGVAMLLGAAACSTDKILKVNDPDVSNPAAFGGKAGLPALLGAAIGDFQVGFSGTGVGNEGLVNLTGLLSDEFFFTETFPTRVEIDRRDMKEVNGTLLGTFFDASKARESAARAAAGYAQFDPTDAGRAEALSLEGYALIFLAEAYCNGVPISTIDDNGLIHYGTPQSNAQLYHAAIADLDSARKIAIAAGDANREYLARVGEARAMVDSSRSNLAAAAAIVAPVPTSFQYKIFHSSNTPRQQNGLWELMFNEGRWVQANREGTNGLPFRNGDPRTPFITVPGGTFTGATFFGPVKASARDSAVILSSGVEARLIEAEALLETGSATFIAKLNTLRAGVTGLAPLVDPVTTTSRQNLLFSERAFWLYATGHRLGDLRREIRQYGRGAETVFPTGPYTGRGGGVYGTAVNFPVPFEERNNPGFPGCTDRAA